MNGMCIKIKKPFLQLFFFFEKEIFFNKYQNIVSLFRLHEPCVTKSATELRNALRLLNLSNGTCPRRVVERITTKNVRDGTFRR